MVIFKLIPVLAFLLSTLVFVHVGCDDLVKNNANNSNTADRKALTEKHNTSLNNNNEQIIPIRESISKEKNLKGLNQAYPYYLAIASPTVQMSPKISPKLVGSEAFPHLSIKEKIQRNFLHSR